MRCQVMGRLGALLLLLVLGAPAYATNWQPVFSTEKVQNRVDVSSMERGKSSIRAWDEERYVNPEQAKPGDFYYELVKTYSQYNCGVRTTRHLRKVYYGADGAVIKTLTGDEFPRQIDLVPGSMEETKYEFVCGYKPPTPVPPVKAKHKVKAKAPVVKVEPSAEAVAKEKAAKERAERIRAAQERVAKNRAERVRLAKERAAEIKAKRKAALSKSSSPPKEPEKTPEPAAKKPAPETKAAPPVTTTAAPAVKAPAPATPAPGAKTPVPVAPAAKVPAPATPASAVKAPASAAATPATPVKPVTPVKPAVPAPKTPAPPTKPIVKHPE